MECIVSDEHWVQLPELAEGEKQVTHIEAGRGCLGEGAGGGCVRKQGSHFWKKKIYSKKKAHVK